MSKKLIFLDIDGTLTVAGSNEPPASALIAIKKTQALGNMVFLCTGRNYAMLSPLLKFGFDGMVATAGGYLTVGDEVIYDKPMTPEQTKTALETLHAGGVFCTIEAKDATYGDEEDLGSFLSGQGEGNSEIERWRKALSSSLNIRPMSEYDGRPVYKVVIMCLEDSQLDRARAALEDQFQFVIQEVSAHSCLNGELINRDFDKGRGILRICEKLGVPVEDTFGFGDSALKKISDYVCPSVENDGLAEAFRHFGLV